jgi:hypothetical protein
MEMFSRLPSEIINTILSFDKHFLIRKGEPVTIIPKDDPRFNMLLNKELLKNGYVYINSNPQVPVIFDIYTYFSNNYLKNMYGWRMIVFHRKDGIDSYYTRMIQ